MPRFLVKAGGSLLVALLGVALPALWVLILEAGHPAGADRVQMIPLELELLATP